MTVTESRRPRVVVVGGGFGGLTLVRALRRAPVDVTLLDRRNFHLFQPLLYQVATGGLSPANIATPLRALVKGQRNTRVLLAEATGVDVGRRRLLLADGEVAYDVLVLATGVRHSYFGRAGWERHAPGLKSLEDATGIRARILGAFEAAEREEDAARILLVEGADRVLGAYAPVLSERAAKAPRSGAPSPRPRAARPTGPAGSPSSPT